MGIALSFLILTLICTSHYALMKTFSQKLSYVFLLAVPFLVTAMAFIFGHLGYWIYLPGWFLNILLMFLAVRTLGRVKNETVRRVAWPLIMSWAPISIFAGMGPPPETAEGWAALAWEQQLRYCILIVSGTGTTIGFLRLYDMLRSGPGLRFAKIGRTMFVIALPLFIANMVYWGFFLTNVFVKYSQPGAPARPDWLQTVSTAFTAVRLIEVTLIYCGTAVFAYALSRSGHLSRLASRIYIFFCCLGAILNLLPASLPAPLAIANYVSYIPAITLLVPYLIGVNLLAKIKKHTNN
ncbi:hypothetical protein GCM10010967_43010 [Dyadobacter beijingensis]|uniref:Uncharacterized protein n=2 Tax=Dyadobacter beijingensis TaxID=365489 RepID=A0ABQ2I8D7_9BACT|nr:hypothetical protein [Dyadobacter beijingensis]GGN03625.1 hypothetical protein GCM10010967_43010 [Dyadobacter beijingensis]